MADCEFWIPRIAYSVSSPINRDNMGRSFSADPRVAFFQILVRFLGAILLNPTHRTFEEANSWNNLNIEIFFCGAGLSTILLNFRRCVIERIRHLPVLFIRRSKTFRGLYGSSAPIGSIHTLKSTNHYGGRGGDKSSLFGNPNSLFEGSLLLIFHFHPSEFDVVRYYLSS